MVKSESRLLSEKDYDEAVKVINQLIKTVQEMSIESDRIKPLFVAELTEMTFRFEHHLLGKDCPSFNLDHMELRRNKLVALMENKVKELIENKAEDKQIPKLEKGYHMHLANRAKLPYFIVIHSIKNRNKEIIIPLGIKKTFQMSWVNYKEFMLNLPESIYKLCPELKRGEL